MGPRSFEPRKCSSCGRGDAARCDVLQWGRARSSRGNARSRCRSSDAATLLQWGRARSSRGNRDAAASRPSRRPMLQWGRDRSSRGNDAVASKLLDRRRRGFNGAAARSSRGNLAHARERSRSPVMRFNGAAIDSSRGNRAATARATRARAASASMGPRLVRARKVADEPSIRRALQRLQWGRDRSIAEIGPSLSYLVFKDLRRVLRAARRRRRASRSAALRHRRIARITCRLSALRAVAGISRVILPLAVGVTASRTRISRQLASHHPREQARLDLQHAPVADTVAEQRVRDQRVHPLLVGAEECLAPVRRQRDGVARRG